MYTKEVRLSDSINDINELGSGQGQNQGRSGSAVGSAGGSAAALDLRSQQKLISARGTEEGLVLRIDGRADWQNIVDELIAFLGERRKFLEGGEIAIEWLDRLPPKEQSAELELLLRDRYGIEIIGRKRKPKLTATKNAAESRSGEVLAEVTKRAAQEAIPLFDVDDVESSVDWKSGGDFRSTVEHRPESIADHKSQRVTRGVTPPALDPSMFAAMSAGDTSATVSAGIKRSERNQLKRMTEMLGEDVFSDEEANARIVYGTLRSGQRIETPFSLIVIGDVNPGADLVAGGDIIVFGAYDDDAEGKVVVALQMQPMQLRLGSVISRGGDEAGRGAEVARIEDRRIIVESFNAKVLSNRRLRS